MWRGLALFRVQSSAQGTDVFCTACWGLTWAHAINMHACFDQGGSIYRDTWSLAHVIVLNQPTCRFL